MAAEHEMNMTALGRLLEDSVAGHAGGGEENAAADVARHEAIIDGLVTEAAQRKKDHETNLASILRIQRSLLNQSFNKK